MLIGSVREFWHYPVKSMQGERLSNAQVGIRDMAHDRGYALLDTETGKIASAKHPRLWGCGDASYSARHESFPKTGP